MKQDGLCLGIEKSLLKRTVLLCLVALYLSPICHAGESIRLAGMNGMAPMDGGIIMVGDSITESGQWSELLGTKVRNAGFDGWTTFKVLANMDHLVTGSPDHIFICIGINDLNSGRSADYVISTYSSIIDKVQAISPASVVYIQSVLPIRSSKGSAFLYKVRQLNESLESLASAKGVKYVDIYSRVADSSGYLMARYAYDRVHINGAGYEVWADVISSAISRGKESP